MISSSSEESTVLSHFLPTPLCLFIFLPPILLRVSTLPPPPSLSHSLQEQPAQANFSNICTGLEILCFLLTVLQSPAILAHFKPLQRGIAACMTCGNTKVLRAVHSLLSRLMSIFPTEPSESG